MQGSSSRAGSAAKRGWPVLGPLSVGKPHPPCAGALQGAWTQARCKAPKIHVGWTTTTRVQGPRQDAGLSEGMDPGIMLAQQVYTYLKVSGRSTSSSS